MNTWQSVKVAELGRIVTGKTPKTAIPENYGGDIPFLTPSDDMSVKYVSKTAKTLTEKGLSEVKNTLLPPDAVCVSCIGSDLGKVVITTEKTVTNQQINSIIVDKDRFDVSFVYYAMLILGKELNFISKTSTAVPIVNKSSFSSYEIQCPSLDQQKRIAAILSALDSKIECNQKINDNLTEQARSIFQSWFVDYEPFGGSKPSDWQPSTLGQIANMKTDSWSPVKNPDVVVEHYSIPSYDEQRFPVFEIASGIKSNKYLLTSDSVMISKLNPDTKRIWRPMCLSGHPVCSTEFIVYESKKKGQRDYIYSLIDSIPFFNHLCSHTTGSTNSRQRATPKSTLDFALCLPSDSVIEDFCEIVTPMYDLIASNVVENQSLAKTRDSLLPRLMSGELDVSDLDL
ncbi:restriction endonuclease subunit S [Anaerotignum lactatifermentans]|uniref:Type I restriction enzyme, S subunit n=1 Tax=Anaerotignum lactatifermentans DSM 14214 TaxID=1121323 RepID=A0A1M6L9J1_9FIRM|nr:restriction endonuclease subunit S [Anaerotignum lactatifermentans]SHJ67871.1 type I restriction enzyme, S subunit [[Clostridium] lactatifermentans DSM 14214] [Anaerotignum lactatifermentans DSM 14214]